MDPEKPFEDPITGQLVEAARKVRNNAYARYSGFAVGAAVADRTGEIYVGCNVENASYGATICAERGAVMSAVARNGTPDFRLLAVVTDEEPPAVPCALCLQVLAEFCEPDFPIVLAGAEGTVGRVLRLQDLLPLPFTSFSV
jgi:homotetrameric cytidine deaminase